MRPRTAIVGLGLVAALGFASTAPTWGEEATPVPTPTASESTGGDTDSSSNEWVRFIDSTYSEILSEGVGEVALNDGEIVPYSNFLARMVPIVEEIVTAHQDNFAGSSIELGPKEVIRVLFLDPDGPGMDEFNQLIREYGDEWVEFVPASVSYKHAHEVGRDLGVGQYGILPSLVDFDMEAGRLIVQFAAHAYQKDTSQPDSVRLIGDPLVYPNGAKVDLPGKPALREGVIDLSQIAKAVDIPFDVVIEEPDMPVAAAATPRDASSAPFAMGASIHNYAGTRVCSMGIPITISGNKTVATAAHCTPKSPPTSNWNKWVTPAATGNLVGTLHYSIWHSQSHGFNSLGGDWQLLKGASRYALDMYNGGPTGSTSSTLTGIDWTIPSLNTYLCTSGQTTGFICSYRVISSPATMQMCANDACTAIFTVGYQTLTRRNVNAAGLGDCWGFDGGDSGGPAVREDPARPGQFWGQALVSAVGGDTRTSERGCDYWIAQLRAIKVYAPGAQPG